MRDVIDNLGPGIHEANLAKTKARRPSGPAESSTRVERKMKLEVGKR